MTSLFDAVAAPLDAFLPRGEPERPPFLEAWYRDRLPRAELDISSSGVYAYRFGEVRRLLELDFAELDAVMLHDSVSYGAPALRRAIADRYAPGRADHVMATHGSSEAIALALGGLLEPGARVVVADPLYHPLRTCAEVRGCEVVRVSTREMAGAGAGAALAAAIVPGTRAVVVNFPHNPTGAVLGAGQVRRLLERCRRAGAVLVWDGAMEQLLMCGAARPLEPPAGAGVVRFGTLSKSYGLPGLRVGWCIAEPALLERTLAVRDRTTLFLSPLVEAVAARAVERAGILVEPRLAEARANLEHLDAWIHAHHGRVAWRRPQGGVCGLMELRGVDDTEPFCRALLEETGVLLVPGAAFESPGQVRIGYGGPSAELREALQRLSGFLRRHG